MGNFAKCAAAERRDGVGRFSYGINEEDRSMLGKVAGAMLGSKLAGRKSGVKGALMGAGVAAVARLGLFPLAMAAGAAYAGK